MRYTVALVVGTAVGAVLWTAVRVVDAVESALERACTDLANRGGHL